MQFETPLIRGKLIRRYKRFLAEVELENGEVVTVHCPNSGSMLQCREPGWPVLLSLSGNPKRKLPHTWEMIWNGRTWIVVNTLWANRIAGEALRSGTIQELGTFGTLRPEVKTSSHCRLDFLGETGGDQKIQTYIEVKSVSLVDGQGRYTFPDAVTERGLRHIDELLRLRKMGHRAVLLFVAMRGDGKGFFPAEAIDPDYSKALLSARKKGLEVLVYGTRADEKEIVITTRENFHV